IKGSLWATDGADAWHRSERPWAVYLPANETANDSTARAADGRPARPTARAPDANGGRLAAFTARPRRSCRLPRVHAAALWRRESVLARAPSRAGRPGRCGGGEPALPPHPCLPLQFVHLRLPPA